jgi:hypothetical protein
MTAIGGPISELEIAGRVTRAEDGAPLPGAEVWLAYPTSVGDGAEIATTDSDGSYELIFDKGVQIATCDGFALYAQAEGYQPSAIRGIPGPGRPERSAGAGRLNRPRITECGPGAR